uniref:Trk family potassium uptake protein n=1 Tax=candidate division WOR-3 bacterium TaxID=2052148 RepID=A0A7V3RI17_UNCW3
MNQRREINPGRLLIIGYAGIITIGAVLLLLPFSTRNGVSVTDAVFTSTSALCVTGLIVKDTAIDFTFWGKLIILILIQIGGLGYMTISTSFFFFLGKKISLRDRILFKESVNFLSYENLMRFAWRIFRITIVVELTGAILLYFYFVKKFEPLCAAGHALFHSVSAFCNAGFSTFSENLTLFNNTWGVPLITALLIITGGIGFIVISDIYYVLVKKAKKDLSLHTKLVLRTTLFLLIFGTIFILLYEGQRSLSQFPLPLKIVHSFFQAVTPRTAGFNTVNISNFSSVTLFLLMIFMFIGASPGGTGGGIKTSTFTLLILWVKELLYGRYKNNVTVMRRSIPQEQAMRAFLIVALSGFLILVSFFLVLLIDHISPKKLIFEIFSAFGTVGLSLGSAINPNCSYVYDLSWFGKSIIIILMVIGKVGTLTLGSALIKPRPLEFSYQEESIAVG